MESPKSLTAIVHVRFNYKEPEVKSVVGESELEIMGRILDRVGGLPPEHQELLVKFAHYLDKLGKTAESPAT